MFVSQLGISRLRARQDSGQSGSRQARLISQATITICFEVVLLVALGAPLRAEPSTSPKIAGEWRGGNINGLVTQPNGCVIFSWVEWTLTLNALSGRPSEFRGMVVTHLSAMWLPTQAIEISKCRFGNEIAFSPSSQGTMRKSVTGRFDASSATLLTEARVAECRGSACSILSSEAPNPNDSAEESKGIVRRTMSAEAGQLKFEDAPGQWIVLRRTVDVVERLAAANKIHDDICHDFDDGNIDRLESVLGSGAHPTTEQLKAFRLITGRIELRYPEVLLLTSHPSTPEGTDFRNFALYVSQISAANGRQGIEIMILAEEVDRWKLAWMVFV